MSSPQRAADDAGQQGERHRAAPGETQRPAAAHRELQHHQPADRRDGQQYSRYESVQPDGGALPPSADKAVNRKISMLIGHRKLFCCFGNKLVAVFIQNYLQFYQYNNNII